MDSTALSKRAFTVGAVARHIARFLTNDPKLQNLNVRGEVSNLKRHASGHFYFALKDDDAVLSCVAWQSTAATLPAFENGQSVIVTGNVTTYFKGSQYQLTVERVDVGGIGDLHARSEKIKRKLEDEGLFRAERKRALPAFPFRIALVSAVGAQGAGDFLTILRERAPHIAIRLFPTAVQGEAAATEIAQALDAAARFDADAIVVARGGGSYEDLFAFNTEPVARAIVRAQKAGRIVVSAIGHEGDTTICDLVADIRAATPSAAAHLVGTNRTELLERVVQQSGALARCIRRAVERRQRDIGRLAGSAALTSAHRITGPRLQTLDAVHEKLVGEFGKAMQRRYERLNDVRRGLDKGNPLAQLGQRATRLAVVGERLKSGARATIDRARTRWDRRRKRVDDLMYDLMARRRANFDVLRARFDGNDPEAILQRGYAIVRANGRALRDASAVAAGERVEAQLARGRLRARVEETVGDG